MYLIVFEEQKIFPGEKRLFANADYYLPKDLDYYLSIMYDDYQKMSPRESGTVKYNLVDMSLEGNYDRKDMK